MRIFGIILAGGSGQRMGQVDKALIPLARQPLLAHVIARFVPQVERLALSANGDPARFAFTGLPVLPDDTPQGPLSGILAGLHWAEDADAVVSVAVDTPFFPGDLVPRLWLAGDGGLAVAACGGRVHPTFALWPRAVMAPLAAALAGGQRKVMSFCTDHAAAQAVFPTAEPDPFFNINTPEDLQQAEHALTRHG